MNSQYTIQNELKDLNSRLPSEKKQTYTTPDGYFENLAADILLKVKNTQAANPEEDLKDLSPLLASIPRTMPFSIPDNYFNQNIITLSDLSQGDSLPPFLAQHNRQMPFEVPPGYFQSLPEQLLNKATTSTGAKVVSFGVKKWMRYASAAIVIGIIALSIFYFQNNKPSVDIAKEPHKWVAKKLQNVSNKDLDQFINTTDISINNQQIAKKSNSDAEVRKMLRNVSTNELDAFLSEVPSEMDESSMVN